MVIVVVIVFAAIIFFVLGIFATFVILGVVGTLILVSMFHTPSLIIAVVCRRRLVKEKYKLVQSEDLIMRTLSARKREFFYRTVPSDFCELENRLDKVKARLAEMNQLNV